MRYLRGIIIGLLVLFLTPAFIFAQGKEYLRMRSGTLPAEGGPVTGEEVKYYIAPDDEIEVFVWQNPDLSKTVIVGPDGMISYPLVGRIQAAGLTIAELENTLTKKFAEYIKYPEVSVIMRKFAGNKIIILGEVNYPGIYTYKGTINLIEAVALAGDFTDKAHSNSVILVRGNLSENPEVKRINMTRAITRGISDAVIVLQPNDVIFVPKTFIANVNKAMQDWNTIITNAQNALGVRQEIRRLQGHER